MIDTCNAILLKFFYFFRQDRSPAAAENFYMTASALLQQVIHVFEILDVPALVARHGNGLNVFLDGAVHHLFNRTVVAEMNHLRTAGLDDAPHDVDCSIMTVKQ